MQFRSPSGISPRYFGFETPCGTNPISAAWGGGIAHCPKGQTACYGSLRIDKPSFGQTILIIEAGP